MFIFVFIIGILVGGTFGFFLSALLRANDNDKVCENCVLNNINMNGDNE